MEPKPAPPPEAPNPTPSSQTPIMDVAPPPPPEKDDASPASTDHPAEVQPEAKKQDEKEHDKNLYENFNFDLNKIKDSAPKRSNSPHHNKQEQVQSVPIKVVVIEENGEINKYSR